jgi:hypothetical protein
MVLVVILTVRSDAIDKFRAFETRAAIVMAKHGGAIERTVAIPPESAGDFMKEVHIVTFPDDQALSKYREDGDLREVAHLREESVVKTEILVGEDGPDYGAFRRGHR